MSDASPSLGSQLSPANRRLESWKAIADYLGRHVTTLQRWEHEEGLPVHRHHHEKRGSVYAFTAELDDWLLRRSVVSGSDRRRRIRRARRSKARPPIVCRMGGQISAQRC